jgi:hypothetical protein
MGYERKDKKIEFRLKLCAKCLSRRSSQSLRGDSERGVHPQLEPDFRPGQGRRFYNLDFQEPFALDPRLHPPG